MNSHKEENAAALFNETKVLWSIYKSKDTHDTKTMILFSHLFFNIALIEKCLYPMDKTNYTRLNYERRLLYLLNYCTILSRSRYFSNNFVQIISLLNKDIQGIEIINYETLYRLGLFNFQISNYSDALFYLKHAKLFFDTEQCADTAQEQKTIDKCYFRICLLITYCYEYMHQFIEAINELVGMDPNQLISNVLNYSHNNINNLIYDPFDEIRRTEVQKYVSDMFSVNSSFYNSTNGLLHLANLRDTRFHTEYNDKKKDLQEVLHLLAHCCNEYGIELSQKRSSGDAQIAFQLKILARAVMLNVAKNHSDFEDKMDFDTCLAMIYGEDKDYDICFYELLKTMSDDKYIQQSEDMKSECEFYYYFVTNFSHMISDEDRRESEDIEKRAAEAYKSFVAHCENKCDPDARAYIEIFKFKFAITRSLRMFEVSRIPEILNDLALDYKTFLDYAPSMYVNKWIRSEYDKIKTIYEFIITLYKQNGQDNRVDIDELYNLADRYLQFYNTDKNLQKGTTVIETLKTNYPNNISINEYDTNGIISIGRVILVNRDKAPNYSLLDNKSFYIEYNPQYHTNNSPKCIGVIPDKDSAEKMFFVISAFNTLIQDFISPQSIFLLAPLTSSLPYQYQTGKFNTLVESLNDSNIRIDRIALPTLGEFAHPLYEQNLGIKPDLHTHLMKIKNSGGVGEVKYIIHGYLMDNTVKDDTYVFVSSKNNYKQITRPYQNIGQINTSLNSIKRRMEEHPTNLEHPKCPNQKDAFGFCCTRHEFFRTMNWDKGEIALLLRQFLVTEKDMSDYDNILINITKTRFIIVISSRDIDQNPLKLTICEYPENPGDQIKIYLPQTENDRENFVVICYPSNFVSIVESDLRILNKRSNVKFWYDKAIAAGDRWNYDHVFKFLGKPTCKGAIVYFGADTLLYSNGIYEEVSFIDRENISLLPIAVGFRDHSQRPEQKLQEAIANIIILNDKVKSKITKKDRFNLFNRVFNDEINYVWRSLNPIDESHFFNEQNLILKLNMWGFQFHE